jgi:hypothetical protein
MTLDESLDRVITIRKRRGRLSYRALKVRFDMDGEYLERLKEEILYVDGSVVEADDRGCPGPACRDLRLFIGGV